MGHQSHSSSSILLLYWCVWLPKKATILPCVMLCYVRNGFGLFFFSFPPLFSPAAPLVRRKTSSSTARNKIDETDGRLPQGNNNLFFPCPSPCRFPVPV